MNVARIVKPQPGPQEQALLSRADILIYGGAAGSGKSWLLVNELLRRVHNPGFRAGIFRRTYPQLKGQGGVWDECQEIYRAFGAKMREGQELDATFPSGANVSFLHLQHEKTKYDYQGHQFCAICFDELTHFSDTQFWYLVSRNRSTCGIQPYIRATCNPEPGWVADFLEWWIDQSTGYAIPERSGKLRYMIRSGDDLFWSDSKAELIEAHPEFKPEDILSVTFICAKLEDNQELLNKDPGYKGRLMAMSKIERQRLLDGNWKVAEGAQIEEAWIRNYHTKNEEIEFNFHEFLYNVPQSIVRRIATIDTAGTSKEKAAQDRGKKPSWSVCAIWDIVPRWQTAAGKKQVILTELMFLRYVWRKQVDWNQLKIEIDDVLANYGVQKAYIENAHFGPALISEIRSTQCELIGPVIPGMGDRGETAKLERAIAAGMLARFEQGKIFLPVLSEENQYWLSPYLKELRTWTGHPNNEADQIDITSYAAFLSKVTAGAWGGVIQQPKVR